MIRIGHKKMIYYWNLIVWLLIVVIGGSKAMDVDSRFAILESKHLIIKKFYF